MVSFTLNTNLKVLNAVVPLKANVLISSIFQVEGLDAWTWYNWVQVAVSRSVSFVASNTQALGVASYWAVLKQAAKPVGTIAVGNVIAKYVSWSEGK